MSNDKLKILHVECPYCDGENVISRHQPRHKGRPVDELQIDCKHCRSFFTLSEGKIRIYMRSKRGLDAA